MSDAMDKDIVAARDSLEETPSASSAGATSAPATPEMDQRPLMTAPSPVKTLMSEISSLRSEQKKAKAERLKLAKELKNCQRKRKRLVDRARQMSSEDLSMVLAMRQEASAAATKGKKSAEATAVAEAARSSGQSVPEDRQGEDVAT